MKTKNKKWIEIIVVWGWDQYSASQDHCKNDDKIQYLYRKFHGLYSVSYEHFTTWDYQYNDLCVCRAVIETVSSNAPLMNNFPCFTLCENNFIEDIFCIISSSWVSKKIWETNKIHVGVGK